MDNSTQRKIRDWQLRRLEIKEQMQLHPDKTLELSRVLDFMDEEHAAILSGASGSNVDDLQQAMPFDSVPYTQSSIQAVAGRLDLQLRVTAENPQNLIRLLEMAVFELQGQVDAKGAGISKESNRYPGKMSGTLGDYNFELRVNDGASHE